MIHPPDFLTSAAGLVTAAMAKAAGHLTDYPDRPTDTHPGPKISAVIDDRFPSVWTNTQQVAQTVSNLGAIGTNVDLVVPRMADSLSMSYDERLARICSFYGVGCTFGLRDLLSFPADLIDVGWRPEKVTHGVAGPLYAVMKDYDLVYTRNLLPMLLAISMKKPVVFETYRLLTQERHGAGRLFSSMFRRLGQNPLFLGLVTHSELARQAFIESGIPEDKVITIHNGIDPAMFEPRLTRQEAREKLDLPKNRPIAVYTGHMSRGKGIGILIEMAARTPEVLFVLVGGPTEEDVARVKTTVEERGLENVMAAGWVKPEQLPPYLYAADVLVIPPSSEPLKLKGHTVLPIKVFSYLAAGRPILAPDLPDTEEVLVHGSNSWRVAPDDPENAAAELNRLISDTDLADRLAEGARRSGQQFTWRRRAEKLRDFMTDALSRLAR